MSSPALIVLITARAAIAPLPGSMLPNKLAPNVPNNMPRNPCT